MRKLNESKCVQCGQEIVQNPRGRRRIFCSQKCANKYHSCKQKTEVEAVGGMVECLNCGKAFERTKMSVRAYCTKKCALAAGRREEVETIRKIAMAKKESESDERFKDFVLSLYLEGYGRMAIVEALEMKLDTLKTWIQRHNNPNSEYMRKQPKIKFQKKASGYAYENARTAEEWVSALRDKMRGSLRNIPATIDDRPVYLMCQTIRINKSAENLCDIAGLKLGLNPFDEGIFAFCGNERDIIRYIFSDGKGLRMLRCRKNSGRYPWPSPKLGTAICVNAQDFELLLHSGDQYRNKALSWDDFDFSNKQAQ